MKYILWLLAILITSTVQAEPLTFTFGNDWFAPNGVDRWLTNEMTLHYGNFGIGNEIYTPKAKRSKEIPFGDRPWDGYSYAEYSYENKLTEQQKRVLISRLGLIGSASGSDSLQKWFHNDLDFGADPQWVAQNPSQLAIDLTLLKETNEPLESVIGHTDLVQSYGVRAGNVIDEIFLDQELRKSFFKDVYFFGGIQGRAVAFNTFLDGRMFEEDKYTIQREWFVAAGRLGVKAQFNNWTVGYMYQYLTEEFRGQDGRHLYGEITLGYQF